jgi:hypothetical protein
MLPATTQAIDPRFLNAYVVHVCPLKRTQLTPHKTCLQVLRAPPLEVQRHIVDLVDRVPRPVKGALIDAMLSDRLDDARFLLENAEVIDRVDRVVGAAQTILDDDVEAAIPYES